MSDGQAPLPPRLQLLWGLQERPRRGPKPGLSLERIVDAAIGLADAGGLGAVSMARVAAELGFTTMSLYRYVPTKDDLLELMVDAASGLPPADAASASTTWREGLTAWARGTLAVYLQHPWMLDVPISGPPLGPNNLAWMDWALASLAVTGLAGGTQLDVLVALNGLVRHEARLTMDLTRAQAAAGVTEEQAMADYGRLLAQLADPVRHPALTALLARGALDVLDGEGGPQFAFDLLLDGLAKMIADGAEDLTSRAAALRPPAAS